MSAQKHFGLGYRQWGCDLLLRSRLIFSVLCIGVSLVMLTACPSKTPIAQAPPPPSPPSPTATIDVSPSTVLAGQPVTITWKTTNATDVSIESIGAVNPNGTQTLVPKESTTYRLTAKGPGGTQESDAHVTVASTESSASNNNEDSLASDSSTRLDIFFDSDDFSIRPDQTSTIKSDAEFLKQHADLYIMIEGHCDEMGSAEYNLALGDRRAEEVKLALEKTGINPARVGTISYGKERPGCVDQTDACWKLNRRAHIVPDQQH
jgi:peptidoglycan-associated lipoprotein